MKQKNIESALKSNEEAFKIIFENTSLGIYIADINGNILDANKTLLELLASPSLEATKKINLLKFQPLIDNGYSELFKTCIKNKETMSFEIKYQSLWGKELIYFVHLVPKLDVNKNIMYIYTIMNDITKQKNKEEEEMKNQKLKSIGLLAGGIAHDFNNLLNGLFGNLSLMKYTIEENHPALDLLESAELSIERAKSLTKQLLIFSKGGEPILSTVSMDSFIKEIVLFHLAGSNVKPVFKIDKDIKVIKADKGQVEQVISNIVINAIQAMPNGGMLYVSLSNTSLHANNAINLNTGEYLEISIKDTGIGISKENLQSIFDPYFTTKGQGNGLGLATSYGIINKHKGTIIVDSEIGKYTKFTIYLPVIKNPPLVTNKLNEIIKKNNSKNISKLNILIMDDEYIIRELLTKMLDFLGHKVTTTSKGEEAIDEYSKSITNNKKFDLIISDLTVPGGLGGKEMLKKILEINSDVYCIVSSGYSNDPIMANYQEYGFVGALEKPYTIDMLKKAIDKVFIK